jgi:hypothetical protein
MEDGCKRYFQLEMDPEGEDVLPLTSVMAREPYLHLNNETGSLKGCFFAFLADFDDPHGTLRAETLNTFGHMDTVAACHQVDDHAAMPEGKTRAGLLCFMGAIPASAHADVDIWQRRWVLLKDCRASYASFTTPTTCTAPRSWSITRCSRESTPRQAIARSSARSSGATRS